MMILLVAVLVTSSIVAHRWARDTWFETATITVLLAAYLGQEVMRRRT